MFRTTSPITATRNILPSQRAPCFVEADSLRRRGKRKVECQRPPAVAVYVEARIAELARRHEAGEPVTREGERFTFEAYRPAPSSVTARCENNETNERPPAIAESGDFEMEGDE